jgi:hypothetical protein
LDLLFGVTLQDYKFDIPDEPSPHSKYHFGVRIRSHQKQVYASSLKRWRWRTEASEPSWISPEELAEGSTKGLDLSGVLRVCTPAFQRVSVLAEATGLLPAKKQKRQYEAVSLAIRHELMRLGLRGLVEHNGKKRAHSAFRLIEKGQRRHSSSFPRPKGGGNGELRNAATGRTQENARTASRNPQFEPGFMG